MMGRTLSYQDGARRVIAIYARTALVAGILLLGAVANDRPATAGAVGVAASQTANSGLTACGTNSGNALYDCVGNVLERLSNEVRNPEARRSLSTAASQLRAATTKVQALSAISQCRAVIAGTLKQLTASGGDGSGLSAMAGVLARAAQLIQSKG